MRRLTDKADLKGKQRQRQHKSDHLAALPCDASLPYAVATLLAPTIERDRQELRQLRFVSRTLGADEELSAEFIESKHLAAEAEALITKFLTWRPTHYCGCAICQKFFND